MLLEFDREKILQFFFAIKEQVDEGLLVIKDNSLSFTAKDTANVWFIDAKFIIPTTEEMIIGIDCKKFYSTLNALKTKTVTINFAQTCHIKGGKIERDVLSLAQSAVGKPFVVPELTFGVWIEVPSIDFVDVLESIDKMGAEEGALPLRVDLTYNKDKFILSATNELHETTHSEFDMISTDKGAGSIVASGFSFDYLLKMAKIIKKTKMENMSIQLDSNYPCKIILTNEILTLTWMLAPRIEEE